MLLNSIQSLIDLGQRLQNQDVSLFRVNSDGAGVAVNLAGDLVVKCRINFLGFHSKKKWNDSLGLFRIRFVF